MNTFFTADTHFGHTNIIKYCQRPFKDAHEMNSELIRRWNEAVQPGDTVYHVGDFAFGNAAMQQQIRHQLNGSIYVIRGNHDEQLDESMFESVRDYAEIKVEGQKIVLFHYGMRTWHHDLRGTWMLYGHSHGSLAPYGKSLDVGVDCWNFTPVSFAQLEKTISHRDIGKHPQWENYTPTTRRRDGDRRGEI